MGNYLICLIITEIVKAVSKQKGSVLLIVLLGIVVLGLLTGWAFFFNYKNNQAAKQTIYPTHLIKLSPTVTPTSSLNKPEQTSLPVNQNSVPVTSLPTNIINPIKVVGDDNCQTKTQEALSLLKTKAPSHYANVTKYIGIIECIDAGSGMLAEENPPRYQVGASTVAAGTIWYAGTIVHDATHSRLYHDYLVLHPSQPVPMEIWTGASAESECLDVQHDALSRIGASQSNLDYVKNIKDTQYWNVPYKNRWW